MAMKPPYSSSETSSALVRGQFLFQQDERAANSVAAEAEKQPSPTDFERKKGKPRRVHRKIFRLRLDYSFTCDTANTCDEPASRASVSSASSPTVEIRAQAA